MASGVIPDNFWVSLSAGVRVFARWKNGKYYKGRIDRVTRYRIHVKFVDGGQIWIRKSRRRWIVVNRISSVKSVFVGMRVIAYWPKAKPYKYYLGRVVRIKPGRTAFYIHYSDGDKGWAPISKIRILPGLKIFL